MGIAERCLVVSSLAVLAASCGGNGGSTGPTEPVDVTGTYEATHELAFVGLTFASCTGRIEIDQQTGSTFSGTLVVDQAGACAAVGGEAPIQGTVVGDRFSFEFGGGGLEAVLEQADCESLEPPPSFEGRVSGDLLTAAQSWRFECPTDAGGRAEGTATWSIEATRS